MRILIHAKSAHPAPWTALSPCGMGALKEMKRKNPDGLVVFAKHVGCRACASMNLALRKVVKGKRAIMEIPVEDHTCHNLLSQLKVRATPTLIFSKKGRKDRKLVGFGPDTEAQLRRLIAG